MTAKRLLRAAGDVLPIHKNAPLLDIGKAQQKLRQGGLARPAHTDKANALTWGDMQVEILKHARCRRTVGIPEPDIAKVDFPVAHPQIGSARKIGHKPRFVEHLRHPARIAERAVHLLQTVVDEVELVRHRVGVGEHEHERAGRDAVPGISPDDEDGDRTHDDDGDARGNDTARERCAHAPVVALDNAAVRLVEKRALVILASVGLHGKDIRDRVGQLTRQLVLRARRLLVEPENPLVHIVGHTCVYREQHHQDGNVDGHARNQHSTGEHDRAKHRQKGKRQRLQ